MSKRLKELQQMQHDLKQEATALLDAADKNDNRDLTPDETARFMAIETELKTLGTDIAAEQAKIDRRRGLEAIRTAPPQIPLAAPSPVSRVQIINGEPDPAMTGGFRNLAEM